MKKYLLIICFFRLSICIAFANTYTVTNTNDAGSGSLRQAILDANAHIGADNITFNIPGTPPHIITPATGLPVLTDNQTIIDGSSQPSNNGYNGISPKIILNGNGVTFTGIVITGEKCEIYGLMITKFGRGIVPANYTLIGGSGPYKGNVICNCTNVSSGIYMIGIHNVVVKGNKIGTDTTGTVKQANSDRGIYILNSDSITIGGIGPGEGNLLSGNMNEGIYACGSLTNSNVLIIEGNKIGTDITGAVKMGNDRGLYFICYNDVTVIGNLISGNAKAGIYSGTGIGYGTVNITLKGNIIGTDINGTVSIGNGSYGFYNYGEYTNITLGGTSPGEGNLISGNGDNGIYIGSGKNFIIKGNKVGTDISGTVAIANNGNGICVGGTNVTIGDTTPSGGNIIAYNKSNGISVGSNNQLIRGNSIFCNKLKGISSSKLAPTITSGGSLPVKGTSNANEVIDVYRNHKCSTGCGSQAQGQVYVGSCVADGSGNWTYSGGGITPKDSVTVTATDMGVKNTSEFYKTNCILDSTTMSVDAGVDKIICTGDSVVLTATGIGGTKPYKSYSWSPSTGLNYPDSSVLVAKPTLKTTYIVTLTDKNNKTATDDIVITVNPFPTAEAGHSDSICKGTSYKLKASGGSSYTWNTGIKTDSLVVSPTQTTTYSVTVKNGGGCSAGDSVVLTVLAIPTAEAGADRDICLGSTTTLIGQGGTKYSWSTVETTSNIIVSPTVQSTYSLTVYSSGGCSSTDKVIVRIGTSLTINLGPDKELCIGESVLLQASGGTKYKWNTGSSSPGMKVSPQLTITYTVTVSDSTSCTGTDDIVVKVNPHPTASAGKDTMLCKGDSISLTGTGGIMYSWSTGDTLIHIQVSPTNTTTYYLTVDDGKCQGTDAVEVTVSTVHADAGPDKMLCSEDKNIKLTATGGHVYVWSTGATTSDITVRPDTVTVYIVTVTSQEGCTGTDAAVVKMGLSPTAGFYGTPLIVYQNDQVQFSDTSKNAVSWYWSFGTKEGISIADNPLYTYKNSGEQTVELIVTSIDGCKDTSIRVNYILVKKHDLIYVPSGFTPNGDDENDVLYVLGPVSTLEFKIYNQWGVLMYETTTQTAGWDGSYNEIPQPNGNYVYTLIATTTIGEKVSMQGVITLIR